MLLHTLSRRSEHHLLFYAAGEHLGQPCLRLTDLSKAADMHLSIIWRKCCAEGEVQACSSRLACCAMALPAPPSHPGAGCCGVASCAALAVGSFGMLAVRLGQQTRGFESGMQVRGALACMLDAYSCQSLPNARCLCGVAVHRWPMPQAYAPVEKEACDVIGGREASTCSLQHVLRLMCISVQPSIQPSAY